MLRVKVVQGSLSAEQADVLAWIAEQHGRGMLDCTTRQCVQIYWITLGAMPEILRRLEAVGLTTTGACGDVTRNVVGCTLAGIAHDEVVDGYATGVELHRRFLGNRAFSNLPRKYKISVTGCAEGTRGFNLTAFLNKHVRANGYGDDLRVHFAGCSSSCAQHQIADIGIEAVLKRFEGEMIEAMDIRIGGRFGPDARFGEVVVKKVPHWDLNTKLLQILELYEHGPEPGETFREFPDRTPGEWWEQQLAEPYTVQAVA